MVSYFSCCSESRSVLCKDTATTQWDTFHSPEVCTLAFGNVGFFFSILLVKNLPPSFSFSSPCYRKHLFNFLLPLRYSSILFFDIKLNVDSGKIESNNRKRITNIHSAKSGWETWLKKIWLKNGVLHKISFCCVKSELWPPFPTREDCDEICSREYSIC